MAQGPLPIEMGDDPDGRAGTVGCRRCTTRCCEYNHQVGLKMVGEMLPDEHNRVTLADETDQYGLRIARDYLLLGRQR